MKSMITAAGFFFAISLTAAPAAFAQMGSSVNIPTGGGAVQTDPPEDKVKPVPRAEVKAARAAKKSKAKQKANHGQTPPAQDSQIPVNPTPDVPTTVTP